MEEDLRRLEYLAPSVDEFAEICHRLSRDAGWWEAPNGVDGGNDFATCREILTPGKIALIHSEVSEMLEGFRKDTVDDHLPGQKGAEVEGADTLIRLGDLFGAWGFRLGTVAAMKARYNARRADHKKENRAKPGGKKF